MAYRQLAPPAFLQAYVEAFWEVTTGDGQPQGQRILPDGCVDIILNRGVPLRNPHEPGRGMAAESLHLCGTMTRTVVLAYDPGTSVFGIRFRPGGLARFVAAPLTATADQTPELAAFAPALARQLLEAGFAEATTLAACGAAATRVLTARLTQFPALDPRVWLAVQRMVAADGRLRVATAADLACLSERQFERRFAALVGVAPQQLTEVLRFRATCARLRAASAAPLEAVALEAGYYDAAHLSRVFRRYAGVAPGQYRRLEAVLS